MVSRFTGDGTEANHFLSFHYFLPTLRPVEPRSWPYGLPWFLVCKGRPRHKGLFKPDLARSLG